MCFKQNQEMNDDFDLPFRTRNACIRMMVSCNLVVSRCNLNNLYELKRHEKKKKSISRNLQNVQRLVWLKSGGTRFVHTHTIQNHLPPIYFRFVVAKIKLFSIRSNVILIFAADATHTITNNEIVHQFHLSDMNHI